MPHLVRIFPAVWAFTEQAVWRGAGARRSVAQGRPQGAGAMAQQKGIEDSVMGNKPGSMGPVLSPWSGCRTSHCVGQGSTVSL